MITTLYCNHHITCQKEIETVLPYPADHELSTRTSPRISRAKKFIEFGIQTEYPPNSDSNLILADFF